MAERTKGTVKWFNNSKGYGFISQENGEDVFVHFKSIVGDGYRTLKENEKVEFVVTNGEKGPQASEVQVIKWPTKNTFYKSSFLGAFFILKYFLM